jgi:7-cyano-7-deazaguanine reductase
MLSAVESFPNQFSGREYEIEITCPEFTAVCPKTGQPDFGTIVITYVPARTCLELKSLKLYLFGYRDRGIFYEHSVNAILDDLVASCQPIRMKVVGQFNPRGGISSRITATYEAARG